MRFMALLILFFLPIDALAGDLTIATFNAEFLTRPKVHVKFGRAFDMTNADEIAQWNEPGFRDQKFAEAAAAVAKVVAGINADVMVLTEVGNEQDVAELNAAMRLRRFFPISALAGKVRNELTVPIVLRRPTQPSCGDSRLSRYVTCSGRSIVS
jgi:hypothetical protein